MRAAAPAALAGLLATAAGHGSLTLPPPRMGAQSKMNMALAGTCGADWGKKGAGTCDWFSQGCQAGCEECTPKCTRASKFVGDCCKTPMKPTWTDPKFRTFKDVAGIDIYKPNPWRAPGFAPMYDPCGVAGGLPAPYKPDSPRPLFPGDDIPGGFAGTDLPEGVHTEWPAGSEQDVAWAMNANHGGGYAYRLCPKSGNLTEKCFQSHHLEFVGDDSWIQFGDDAANRTAIPATRISEGTNPPGAQWTKNPIPACSLPTGGGAGTPCNEGVQFDPPLAQLIPPRPPYTSDLPGLYGFGEYTHCHCGAEPDCGGNFSRCEPEEQAFWKARFNFNIIDRVRIPADLPQGNYLLSFRWDCEQTTQIWASCADITITAPKA